MEMTVERGRGYVTAAEHIADTDEQEIGLIPVDSIYSPVTRVRYKTEDTRVGQRTNYDKLTMEIWTNGTIAPEDALVEAAKILRKHLNPFVQYGDMGPELEADRIEPEPEEVPPEVSELQKKLDQPISVLELGVRPSNCLSAAKIASLRQLVQLSEADLLKVRSFGRTSLREVKRKLSDLGLTLGMDLASMPPPSETPDEGNQ
jgi:DNA-directed RNA polymerase subunit alpha